MRLSRPRCAKFERNFTMEEFLGRIASALERLATVHEATEARLAARYAKAEPDGRETEAQEIVKSNPTLSGENVVALPGSKGIVRAKSWVRQTRITLGLPVGRRPFIAPVPKPTDH